MIVFGLPMYGGQCTAEFANSMALTQASLDLANIPYRDIVHINDSLIPRARNCIVARFMRDPELSAFDTLMFIDADIKFAPDDVAKLWNLNAPVATACYPRKQEGAGTTAWVNGALVDLDALSGPTPIDLAGTGFLMIKRSVFEKMQEAFPETRHMEGNIGEVYALFDCKVSEHEDWTQRYYISEDYLFCERWRSLGGEVILDPSIRLGHVGRKVYY